MVQSFSDSPLWPLSKQLNMNANTRQINFNHSHTVLCHVHIDSKTFDQRVYNPSSRYPPRLRLSWIFLVGFRMLLWCGACTRCCRSSFRYKQLCFFFRPSHLFCVAKPITVDGCRFKYAYVSDFHHCQSKRPLAHEEMTSVDTHDDCDDDDDESQKPDRSDIYL